MNPWCNSKASYDRVQDVAKMCVERSGFTVDSKIEDNRRKQKNELIQVIDN